MCSVLASKGSGWGGGQQKLLTISLEESALSLKGNTWEPKLTSCSHSPRAQLHPQRVTCRKAPTQASDTLMKSKVGRH